MSPEPTDRSSGAVRRLAAIPWLPAAGLGVLASALCAVTWLASYDDAYITYAYARNLAAGDGWTWAGERVLGTSTPLFAAILAGLHTAAPLGIPVWGHLISWLSAWLTGVGLCSLGHREGWPQASLVAAAIWVTAPATLAIAGSEYLPGIACIVGAAVALSAGRSGWAGAALASAVGLRPELGLAAIVLALVAFLRLGWRDGSRLVTRTAATALALWAAWLLALFLWAGTCLPVTFAAKRAQGATPYWPGGWKAIRAAWQHGRDYFFPHALAGLLLAAVAAAPRLAARARRWPHAAGLVTWGGIHLLLLVGLGVPYYHWYVAPAYLAVFLAVASLVEPPLRLRRWRHAWTAVALGGISVLLAADTRMHLGRLGTGGRELRERAYRETAAWIDARYSPTTSVGSFEVGVLGYSGRFRTIDFLGLVNPHVPLDALRAGDFHRIWNANRPDLLLYLPHVEGLVRLLVGDPRAFVREYRLERFSLEPVPAVFVFRRAALPPRGEVLADLLASGLERGFAVVFENRGGLSVPALVLPAGSSVAGPVSCPERCSFAAGLAAANAGGHVWATATATAGSAGPVTGRASAGASQWESWGIDLPEVAGTVTLSVSCAPESTAPCLLAIPHLRRRTAAP